MWKKSHDYYSRFWCIMSEGRSVLSHSQRVAGNKMFQVSVKKQKNSLNLLKLNEKWSTYKPRRFSIFFKLFWFSLIPSLQENLKNTIFEMPIIPQILTINNRRTTRGKVISLHTLRNLIEYMSTCWCLKESQHYDPFSGVQETKWLKFQRKIQKIL